MFVYDIMQKAEIDLKFVMMDKSIVQISAIEKLAEEMKSAGKEPVDYLLCIFHMFQDFERFCRASDNLTGTKDAKKLQRMEVYSRVRTVQVCKCV
jgi:hypothetical protein